jgi:hypothetical protein
VSIVCIKRPNRVKKRVFSCADVNRIVRNVRDRGGQGCSDAELMSAVLHGYGLQDVVCYFANVLDFFARIKVFLVLYYVSKMVKSLLVLYNIVYRGARRVLTAKILGLVEVELGVGWLSKMAVWGVELSAAIDVLIGSLVVVIAAFENLSGISPFLVDVCSHRGQYVVSSNPSGLSVVVDGMDIGALDTLESDMARVSAVLSDIFE